MTIKDRLIKLLMSRGMPEHQSKKVIELAAKKIDKALNGYNLTWNDPEIDLPFIVYSKLWKEVLQEEGLEWIKKNNQHAFYRKNFEERSNDL